MKKRFISIILILASAITFSMGIIVMNKELLGQSVNRMAVISDLHIVADSYFSDKETFTNYANSDKLLHLSEAITKSIVDDVIANKKIKTVLIPGDLTESGDPISHQATANALQKLKKAGIKVFVINGNHDNSKSENDPNRIKASQFRKVYWEFGYSDAIARDDNSLSYVADINKEFRLIAIDNDDYYNDVTQEYKEEVDSNLLTWVFQQLSQCKKDGKIPIAMAHKPFVNHLGPLGYLLGRVGFSLEFTDLADLLADNGCQYVFTGHMHGQDIDYYTSSLGNKFVDIQTSSSAYYPNAYRMVSFSKKKVTIESKILKGLKKEYLSPFLDKMEQEQLTTDFSGYSYQHFHNSINTVIKYNFNTDAIMSMLGLAEEHRDIATLIVNNILNVFLDMPIYSKGTEPSFDKLLTSHGLSSLPLSEYEHFSDLIAFFVGKLNLGDEDISFDAVEVQLLKNSIFVLIYLFNENSNNFALLYPDAPLINIDLERLFQKGELELEESNLLEFLFQMFKDSIPKSMQNMHITTSFLKSSLVEILINSFVDGLGTELVQCLGEDDLKLEELLNKLLAKQFMQQSDDSIGDNNVVIIRSTLLKA